MRSKTFCVVPWVQLATNATGKYRVCCNSVPGKNLIRNSDDQPMKINKDSLSEVWQSKTYQKIRQQFLDGERPEMCTRCFREEDSGVKSARQSWNEKWISDQEQQVNPSLDIKYVDLRLGNLCNLKCRMCNPYASSKWVDEWNSVAGSAELVPNFSLSNDETQRLKKVSWPDDAKTWEHLSSILDSVEEIYLTGGEPFLSLRQVDFLKQLVDQRRSRKIKLKYNTNLTYLPAKLVDLWPHFKRVTLNVSIDGVGALDEYIRYPTEWSTVHRHMQDLLEMESQVDSVSVGVHTTVQMYNILHLSQILSFFDQEYKKTPYLNILNHPHCLNIRVLQKELKLKVSQDLQGWIQKKEVEEVVNYMNQEDWFESHGEEFVRYTQILDQNRGQNLIDHNPEYSSVYSKEVNNESR